MVQAVSRSSGLKYLLAGGSMVLAIGMLADVPGKLAIAPAHQFSPTIPCQQVIAEKAFLSRPQLSQFLTIPEGATQAQVQAVLQAPFCQLADLQVRPGVTARRLAYPLEFDPKTWVVVLYEGESYAGYTFSFRR